MLNQDLIKQFKHIKEGTLTGVLQLQDDGRIIRFYFEEGSLLLLDFGQDKEIVIAEQFVKHHKIDDTMGQYAKTLYNDSQTPVAQTLLKQQLISQAEVDQVTRSMVEDLLCYSFSSKLATSWINAADVDIESFDLNKTAVKIRIDIDMLLTMVQSRVQERDAVQQRIDNWDTIYSIEEGAPDDSQLNEMERNVLHFIDGRQSAKDVARSMRESNINIGIYLCSLENQGFVRKGGIRQSTRIAVQAAAPAATSTPVTPAAPAAATAVTDDPFGENGDSSPAETGAGQKGTGDFKVYTASHVRNEKSGNLGRVILIIILLAVVGVSWLVYSRVQAQERQRQLHTELLARIQNNQWPQAEKLIIQSYELAGSDLVGRKRIDKMVGDIRTGYEINFASAESFLGSKDLAKMQDILNGFPERSSIASLDNLWTRSLGDRLQTLRSKADELEQGLADLANQLEESVRNLLRSNNVVLAISQVENRGEYISESSWAEVTKKSLGVLERWRTDTLNEVENSTDEKSYKWKFQQLSNVKLANPNKEEQGRIAQIESALKAEQQELLKRLTDIPGLLTSGNYMAAGELLMQLEDNSMALPEEKAELVIVYMGQKSELESRIKDNRKELEGSLEGSISYDALRNALDAANKDLEEFSDMPDREGLQILVSTSTLALTSSAEAKTLEDEIKALSELPENEAVSAELLSQRIQSLTIIAKTAFNKMDAIRKHSREGSIDEAIIALNSFINNPSFMRTVAMIEANELLKALQERKAKNDKIFKDFRDAIINDDVALVSQLLPQLEQKSLPFVVSSVPTGAKIYLNGEDTGKVTPQLYPASSNAERTEMVFSIQKEGYRIAEVTPLNAESSWRVRALLQRKPIAEAQLKESVYSTVAEIDGSIWLSSNKSVWKIDQDGKAQSFVLESSATTIFAPAIKANGNVYVPTRDRFVIRINEKGEVTNIPVSLSSDHAALHYISPVMLDSELLIITGAENGNIHAINEISQSVQWTVDGIGRVATSPILNEDKVLVIYQNGECRTYDANNGDEKESAAVGDQIISSWSKGGVLYGYTHNSLVTWDGVELKVENLLKSIVNGGPDVIKTKDNRIRVPNDEGRFDIELGRISEEMTGQPLMWNGHAVCPVGNVMHILGARGFTIEAAKPMLSPIVIGELLIIASSDGEVRILKQ